MTKIKYCFLALFYLNFLNAQIKNQSFEKSENDLPKNWEIKKTDSYSWKLDNNQSHKGKHSFQLTGISNDTKNFQPFSQVVAVSGKGLRKVEVSAYIKSENIKGNLNLWTQVWNADKEKIGFGNSVSQNRKISVNQDWTKYSLEFTIDDDAKYLLIGGLLSGNGTVWFDDFEIKNIDFPKEEASKEASDYIENFKNIVKTNSLFSDKMDWKTIEANLQKFSKGSKILEDTNPALQYIMDKLKKAGDKHSFVQSKKNSDIRKNSDSIPVQPEFRLLDNKIGYIMVPRFNLARTDVGNEFAKKIQDFIEKLDTESEIKGWIVDLRTNSGGNSHAMIAGLRTLLGDETLGYFIKKNEKIPWKFINGKYGKYTASDYKLKKTDSKIAVLIDKQTASAGEMTAISFIGKPNVKLFGQPSGGFTSANKVYPLNDGRALALAVSFEMDRIGKEYYDEIIPDVIVEKSGENDNCIETAKQWLNE